MPNKLEEIITKIAQNAVPRGASTYGSIDDTEAISRGVNISSDGLNPRVVPDDSGKRYFAFGISRWKSSDADIIAE
jgi:hypothetical protein